MYMVTYAGVDLKDKVRRVNMEMEKLMKKHNLELAEVNKKIKNTSDQKFERMKDYVMNELGNYPHYHHFRP